MNYYEVLELTKDASPEDIKKQYRKLAMKYHPDRTAGDKKKEELFKNINAAYETLSDPVKKKNYDNELSAPKKGFTDFSTNFHDFGRGDLNSMFEEMFRQRHGFNHNQFTPKIIEVKLKFWEAVLGCEKTFKVNLTLQSGKKREDELSIRFPSGVDNNDRIQVKSSSGEVFIVDIVAPDMSEDENFKRVGNDLYTILEIPFATAALGKKIVFNHWDSDLEISIPAGIESGQMIRLKGKGVKGEPRFGDIYIEIKVKTPKKISKQTRDLIEQLNKELGEDNNMVNISNSWKK